MQGMRESITEALRPVKLDIQDVNGSCLSQAAFLQPAMHAAYRSDRGVQLLQATGDMSA